MLFFLNNLVGKVVLPEFYTKDKLKKKRENVLLEMKGKV